MRIMMVGLLPLELGEVKGGVVSVILGMLEAFSRIPDIQVIQVSFNQEIDSAHTIEYSRNVTIHYLPFRSRAALLDYAVNAPALRDLVQREQPDIIHIQEVTPQLLRFLRWDKSHLVVTQHGIMSEEFRTAIGFRNKIKSFFKGFIEQRVFPTFPNIIFISSYNRSLFLGKPEHATRIFIPVNRIFLEATVPPGDPRTILYVGVLNVNKNIRLVLESLRELREQGRVYRLEVVGGFKDEAFKPVLEDLVRENGVEAQVRFHGWKTPQEILTLHERCGIFILPSKQENMPVSIAESMSTGRVVIASDVGAIREMFVDGQSGFLFPKDDLAALTKILLHLYDHPEKIREVGQAAIQEARTKFDPDMVVAQTVAFYRAVLKDNGPASWLSSGSAPASTTASL